MRWQLGTDLMRHVPGNALWHTGNAVPMYRVGNQTAASAFALAAALAPSQLPVRSAWSNSDGDDYRQRMPWVYKKAVEEGQSAGRGVAHAKRWREWVRTFLAERW